MNSKVLVACLAVAILILLGRPLPAALVVPLSIEQLARQSEVVLRGKVLGKACLRDAAGRIYTKVELEVAEVWKGRVATNRFTVVHAGGTLGGASARAPEDEAYLVGEEVVIFAVLNPRGEAVALGLGQGKFIVREEAREKFVRSRFHGAAGAPEIQAQMGTNAKRGPLSLKELKQRATAASP